MSLTDPPEWAGASIDPDDEEFGDVVQPATLGGAGAFDAVLVGEPYDGAVIGRRGARDGPAAIRDALAGLKTHHFDAGPIGAVGDLGDVRLPPWNGNDANGNVEEVQESIRAVAAEVQATAAVPVFLGGDNSLTVPNAAPLLERGSLGCINFDAHLDVRSVDGEPSSGTPYRQLIEAGLDAYACVGARHFETSTTYHDYARQHEATIVTAEEVGEDSVAAVDRALNAMDGRERRDGQERRNSREGGKETGIDQVYVSLDVDVLDATAAPGVSAPTPGGISTRELFRMLRMVAADSRVAGFEVVECAPPLDRDDRTVRAAARAIAHFLSGSAAGGRT